MIENIVQITPIIKSLYLPAAPSDIVQDKAYHVTKNIITAETKLSKASITISLIIKEKIYVMHRTDKVIGNHCNGKAKPDVSFSLVVPKSRTTKKANASNKE